MMRPPTQWRGGHRASVPPSGWTTPERLVITDETCSVLFVEEKGGASKVFDFATLAVAPEVQRWLARSFAVVTLRGGVKRTTAATSLFMGVQALANHLGGADPAPQHPAQITPAHIAALILSTPVQSKRILVDRLRWLLREDQELPKTTREAVLHGRKPAYEPQIQPYTASEYQEIMTAVRRDIRRARERIAEGRRLLERYRSGELGAPARGNTLEKVGRALDVLDRTGELPRTVMPSSGPEGVHPAWITTICGGAREMYSMLTLTRGELMAFALLLIDLTSENCGTITQWPAVHFRPDGGLGGPTLALVDAVKPRRGPALEFMVTPLEDLPASLGGLFETADDDKHLMRSPLQVYLLLLDLTGLARRHTGGGHAFCYPTPQSPRAKRWHTGLPTYAIGTWATKHGFPLPSRSQPDAPQGSQAPDDVVEPGADRPSVSVLRLRRFALERGGRPVAHTRETYHDHYLRTSGAAAEQGRTIMREALGDEVAKARTVQTVPIINAELLARAERDPLQAAVEVGVDADTFLRIVAGEQDTVILACTDPDNSPVTGPGKPCGASFLQDCLRCENARALPRQLPVQVATHDRLKSLRSNLDAKVWASLYADPFARLSDLLGRYSPAERDDARPRLSSAEQTLVDDLVNGRLDLR